MGTKKKLVLASVVSMMLVLAFMVGFLPSHDDSTTRASDAGDRIDMPSLLDQMLGDKAITAITPDSRLVGITVKTPQANAETPYIPIPVIASTTGTGGTVYHVLNGVNGTLTAGTRPAGAFMMDGNGRAYWTGSNYKDGLLAPTYFASFDAGGYLSTTPGVTTLVINSLVASDAVYNIYTPNNTNFPKKISYDVVSDAADQLLVKLDVRDQLVDNNGNALPDDLFSEVGAKDMWVANIDTGLVDEFGHPIIRTVLAADLDTEVLTKAAGDTVTLTPTANVTVEVPSTEAFIAAGLAQAGDQVVGIAQVVSDLRGAVDSVDGDSGQTAINAWADRVLGAAPGEIVAGAPYVDVTMVKLSGSTVSIISSLPETLEAKVTVSGITFPETTSNIAIYGVRTALENSEYTNVPDVAPWHLGDAAPVLNLTAGSYVATLHEFSAFVPVVSELAVDSVSPEVIPSDIAVPVTLTGVFPTYMAANIYAGLTTAEATANYAVYFEYGTQKVLAPFRAVSYIYNEANGASADVAVTALNQALLGAKNQMFVTSPGLNIADLKAAAIKVTVEDLTNPANVVSLDAAVDFQNTVVLTLTKSGTGTGNVVVAPTSSQITVDNVGEVGDSQVITFPANTYFVGTSIQASATPDSGSVFTKWTENSVAAGNVSPLNFVMNADKTLDAQFDLLGAKATLTLLPSLGGTVAAFPAQPVGGYDVGTTVTLTATPDANFLFTEWVGANAGELVISNQGPGGSTATLLIDGNKTVGAAFVSEVGKVFLDLQAGVGGTAVAAPTSPYGGGLYDLGAVVTITATPDANFLFDGWTGTSAAELADATNPVQTVTLNAAKQFIANFRQSLNITAITPNNAWIFGGVVARISGTGLSLNTKFSIGGKTAWGFNPAADGSTIDVVVPASSDATDNALVITSVTAAQGATVTPALPFTYKRYFEDAASGKNTTAFILSNPTVENTVKLTTGGGDITSANLIIPGLNTTANRVFGIVVNQKLTVPAVKSTTAPVPSGSTAASLINEEGQGSSIANAYDFSVYVYTDSTAAKSTTSPVQTTPPADAQTPFYQDASADLLAFNRGDDGSGIPNSGVGMKLTFPIDQTGLTYGDVRTGLTMWGIESQYNYVTDEESYSTPKVVDYQSQILGAEVDPALTESTPDANKPDQVVKARLYSLNGFSLRKGAVLPTEVADAIRLAKVDGVAVAGTGSGPKSGGTVLTLVSPLGGLGYVDRIELVEPSKFFCGKLGGVANSSLFVSKPGADEYTFEFKTPKSGKAGIVDMVVYLKSNPDVPAAVLPKAFEYKRQSTNILPILLVLLGVIAAIVGIAAGGDSGGGGGGPCFIASAAYGTPMAAEIDTLRSVRDTFMLDNTVGTAFVDSYYRVSPAVADVIAQHPVLAAMVRLLLVPVIFIGKVALMMPVPTALVALSLGAAFMLRRRSSSRA